MVLRAYMLYILHAFCPIALDLRGNLFFTLCLCDLRILVLTSKDGSKYQNGSSEHKCILIGKIKKLPIALGLELHIIRHNRIRV